MWKGRHGPCTCYYCKEGQPHPTRAAHAMTETRGHLQVVESLNPKDIIWTKMCPLCTHEEPR